MQTVPYIYGETYGFSQPYSYANGSGVTEFICTVYDGRPTNAIILLDHGQVCQEGHRIGRGRYMQL